MTTVLEELAAWLQRANAEPVASKLVPGASEAERAALGALGGLVRHLLADRHLNEFPSDLLEWITQGPEVPSTVVDQARLILKHEPDAALASLYGRLVAGENRRLLGTFFTPRQEVELMLDMWQKHEATPQTVIDVGAGVGVFTASAAIRWPKAHIFAIDINPVTLGLLALRVAGNVPLTHLTSTSPGIRLIRDDYTSWIRGAAQDTAGPRLILGNPPYTRAQLLSLEDRARLGEASGGLCGTRASLSALITAITLQHLEISDGMCLLLPAQWLESDYARRMRNYLADMTHRRIELRLVDSWRFPDAKVDAVALLVGRQHTTPQELNVATWQSTEPRSIDRLEVRDRPWRSLFNSEVRPRPLPDTRNGERARQLRLSDVCAVRRGTATGGNDFFLLNDDEVQRHRIPHSRLLPVARRLVNFETRVDDRSFGALAKNEKRWLLNTDRRHRVEGSAVDRYLRAGEELGLPLRVLCNRRTDWYDLSHDIVVPDVIIGTMTRSRVRIVENVYGCVITNNLYGLRWSDSLMPKSRARVLAWLRSEDGQLAIQAISRKQADGLFKIEPLALASLAIPSFNIKLR